MLKNEKMRKQFKDHIYSGKAIQLPVAPDALAAKIAEKLGFDAVFSAGYATSASAFAMPDRGITDFGKSLERTRDIINAVNIPVFADADTGYGDLENVRRTVENYEAIGAAGIFIEDQVWPKRCGHMSGKQVEPTETLEEKIKVAVATRKNDDFLIMSRTDARTVYDLEEAIERSRRYKSAGADLIFIESPRSFEEFEDVHKALPDTFMMANMIEGGLTPLTKTSELEKLGFNIIVYPTALTYAQAYTEKNLLQTLRNEGTTRNYQDKMITFDEFNEFIGLDDVNQCDAAYAPENMLKYMD
ncbi:isocitrate lyase/PEP mutase family protein [Aerococcus urinaeequi]|uniref:Carboxyvinyl-carboxyphosphonate phosphorylmutase n=2 Tax=Aerococcus TaxID=1375 RepID=A0A2N6UGE6_9LACT|nr:oxaloacetate decarboxylase [Aerococcus viridans]PMC80576.1 carboxyvinyl-carboxyphosphonate phosphorylmutase [Aerococcus viridans]